MVIHSSFSHWKWWFSIAMLNYQRVFETIKNDQECRIFMNFCSIASWQAFDSLASLAHSPWHFVGQLRPFPKVFLANTCEAKGLYLSSHSQGQGWFTCVLHVSCLCSKNKVANVCVCKYVRKNPYVCSRIYMQIIWLMNMYTYAIYIIMCVYKYICIYIYILYKYVHSCAQMDIP